MFVCDELDEKWGIQLGGIEKEKTVARETFSVTCLSLVLRT